MPRPLVRTVHDGLVRSGEFQCLVARSQNLPRCRDAVLSSQRSSETVHTSKHSETLSIRTDITPERQKIGQSLQSPSPPEEARSEYTSSSALKVSLAQQTPPPTPVAKSPRHRLSPLSVSPPRPPSQFSDYHSRSKSPSIANLGTLSVVTQRLAQIERSELASPTSSAVTSSSVGTALRRAQTNHPTHQGRPFAEIEKLQGENAGGSQSKVVNTPSTDASIVIPLPKPPNVPPSETGSVRSAFRRNRPGHQLSPAPTPPSSPMKTSASLATPVATLRAKLSEPAIREHVENPPTSPLVVGVEPQLAPLAELIKDAAAKHYDQTAGLGEQIISLQRDVHILPNEIQVLLGQAVTAAAKRTSDSNDNIDNESLQNILASLQELRKQILANSKHPQVDSLVKMFEGLQTQLAALAPVLMEKLESIEHGQTQLQALREVEKPAITYHETRKNSDVPPSPRPSSPTKRVLRDESRDIAVDLSDIHSKLDELTSLCRSSAATGSTQNEIHGIPSSQTSNADSEKVCGCRWRVFTLTFTSSLVAPNNLGSS